MSKTKGSWKNKIQRRERLVRLLVGYRFTEGTNSVGYLTHCAGYFYISAIIEK